MNGSTEMMSLKRLVLCVVMVFALVAFAAVAQGSEGSDPWHDDESGVAAGADEPSEDCGCDGSPDLMLPLSLEGPRADAGLEMAKGCPSFWGVRARNRFECVDYAARFWRHVWGYWPGTYCPEDLYYNASVKGLVRYPNRGLRRPRQGDMIIWERPLQDCGHVVVVKRVNLNTGHNQNARILLIEQNWDGLRCGQRWLTLRCSHKRWTMPRSDGMPCLGWLRAKKSCATKNKSKIWGISPGDAAWNLKAVRRFCNAYSKPSWNNKRYEDVIGRPTKVTRMLRSRLTHNTGWYQRFKKGVIFLRRTSKPAYVVYGGWLTKWSKNEKQMRKPKLGFPISDVRETRGGRHRQKFEGGSIWYNHGHWRIEYNRRKSPDTDKADMVLSVSSLSASATGATAQVVFTFSTQAAATVDVTNIAGRPIRRLVTDRQCEAGINTLLWDGRSANGLAVPSGMYLITIAARNEDGATANAVTTLSLNR